MWLTKLHKPHGIGNSNRNKQTEIPNMMYFFHFQCNQEFITTIRNQQGTYKRLL